MSTHTLKKVTAQNYKNLSLMKGLKLSNLNLFIGPNGSGKSNLIGVLKFLRDSMITSRDEVRGRTGFEDAVFELGGAKILDGTVKTPANVKLAFNFEPTDEMTGYIFDLDILIQDAHTPVVVSNETLRPENSPEEADFYTRDEFGKETNLPTNELILSVFSKLLEQNLKYPSKIIPILKIREALRDTVSGWRFYNANNMNLKGIRRSEPKVGPSDKYLAPSGENLPLVLHNLMQNSLDFEEKINNAMKAILPITRKVRTFTSGRSSLTIEWHFEDINTSFYLDEMSDGTVRMLCWATILHSPQLPSLLVIDEPEMGIHVAWLPILAEWIKEAATKTQVIVCTHSPDLLDHFTDHVENVFVFQMVDNDKNHFAVETLSQTSVAAWLAEGWQLGDLYRVGNPSVGGWPW